MSYQLIEDDCLMEMKKIANRGVDAVIADPPYGIGESRNRVLSRGQLAIPTDYGDFDWDSQPAEPQAIEHILRVSKKQVIFGGNYFSLPPTSCWLIWDKLNSGDFADCEMAWTNLPGAVRIFRHRWNGFIRASEPGKRVHPAQKPVALMRWVLERLNLPPGATILDPYMGSASVGIAALQARYNYIGIEKDERMFAIGKRRMADADLAAAGLPKQLSGTEADYAGLPMFSGL